MNRKILKVNLMCTICQETIECGEGYFGTTIFLAPHPSDSQYTFSCAKCVAKPTIEHHEKKWAKIGLCALTSLQFLSEGNEVEEDDVLYFVESHFSDIAVNKNYANRSWKKELCQEMLKCHLINCRVAGNAATYSLSFTNLTPANFIPLECLKVREINGGAIECKVRWAGFSTKFASWEPLESVSHCQDIFTESQLQLINTGFKQDNKSQEYPTAKTTKESAPSKNPQIPSSTARNGEDKDKTIDVNLSITEKREGPMPYKKRKRPDSEDTSERNGAKLHENGQKKSKPDKNKQRETKKGKHGAKLDETGQKGLKSDENAHCESTPGKSRAKSDENVQKGPRSGENGQAKSGKDGAKLDENSQKKLKPDENEQLKSKSGKNGAKLGQKRSKSDEDRQLEPKSKHKKGLKPDEEAQQESKSEKNEEKVENNGQKGPKSNESEQLESKSKRGKVSKSDKNGQRESKSGKIGAKAKFNGKKNSKSDGSGKLHENGSKSDEDGQRESKSGKIKAKNTGQNGPKSDGNGQLEPQIKHENVSKSGKIRTKDTVQNGPQSDGKVPPKAKSVESGQLKSKSKHEKVSKSGKIGAKDNGQNGPKSDENATPNSKSVENGQWESKTGQHAELDEDELQGSKSNPDENGNKGTKLEQDKLDENEQKVKKDKLPTLHHTYTVACSTCGNEVPVTDLGENVISPTCTNWHLECTTCTKGECKVVYSKEANFKEIALRALFLKHVQNPDQKYWTAKEVAQALTAPEQPTQEISIRVRKNLERAHTSVVKVSQILEKRRRKNTFKYIFHPTEEPKKNKDRGDKRKRTTLTQQPTKKSQKNVLESTNNEEDEFEESDIIKNGLNSFANDTKEEAIVPPPQVQKKNKPKKGVSAHGLKSSVHTPHCTFEVQCSDCGASVPVKELVDDIISPACSNWQLSCAFCTQGKPRVVRNEQPTFNTIILRALFSLHVKNPLQEYWKTTDIGDCVASNSSFGVSDFKAFKTYMTTGISRLIRGGQVRTFKRHSGLYHYIFNPPGVPVIVEKTVPKEKQLEAQLEAPSISYKNTPNSTEIYSPVALTEIPLQDIFIQWFDKDKVVGFVQTNLDFPLTELRKEILENQVIANGKFSFMFKKAPITVLQEAKLPIHKCVTAREDGFYVQLQQI